MDYEPLDGSVVSIDTTLNDGFMADMTDTILL